MNMITIDLDRIRKCLPNRAQVTLKKNEKGTPYIECIVRFPSLCPTGDETISNEVIEWQREIIGDSNILEFYTEETGSHWMVYLKRQPIEFLNVDDNSINKFSGVEIMKDGKLNS